ncbi:C6 zinc finger domain-containingprotein [Purpureocillium lavendulum]|uniref:C6 zinc finger domain-containingprotein n=1 Tax=Purpureocillium lavendulum TaxID=1247861 RepID=A0AB34G6G7_9HYPO|nr:C6 zinc finger domain-containingprotein [Purpureocillium lavendulum]
MATTAPIIFDIHRKMLSYHYTVTAHHDSANPDDPIYYCDVNRFTKSASPDLVLHAGPSTAAPPIAISHILQFSQSFKIGLGDAVARHKADPDAVQWEDLRRTDRTGAEHRWGLHLPATPTRTASPTTGPGSEDARDSAAAASSSGRRLALLWKRTRSVRADGVEDGIRYRGFRGWKLLDEARPDEVLAVFTMDRVFGRRGVLQINVDYGGAFVVAVLMTLLTLYERSEER